MEKGLLEQGFDLIEPHIPTIIAVVVAVLIVAWFAKAGIHQLIELGQRWAGYEEIDYTKSRLRQPSTWFKLEPKAHLKIKEEILTNQQIREAYVNPSASRFQREIDKKKLFMPKHAWLSPYPEAIKAAIKDSETPSGKKLLAHKLVREAARSIEIRHLPEDLAVANGLRAKDAPTKIDPETGKKVPAETEKQKEKRLKKQHRINEANHFQINMSTLGDDPDKLAKYKNLLLTQLNLKGGIQRIDQPDPTILAYAAHRVPAVDPLTDPIGCDYLNEHPAASPNKLVLGIDGRGKPYYYRVHHTMILGTSGSGKGSPIQATIRQLAPFVKQGIVEQYFADPKRSEAALYAKFPSKLFKRISMGSSDDAMREHADVINHLLGIINERAENAELSIEKGKVEDGRSFAATKKNPLIMFYIDEFPSLFLGFKKMKAEGALPLQELEQVISMGRSFGVYVFLATQRGKMDLLEPVRENISVPILLRQPNRYMNDLFLGEGALAAGYDSTSIPMSAAPDYETAGIGYAFNDKDQIVKVRFAYIDKEDIGDLIRDFREVDESELRRAYKEDDERRQSLAQLEAKVAAEDEDGGFAITDANETPLPELEEFFLD